MSQNKETKIQNAALLKIGRRRDVLCWRQNVGKFRSLFSDAIIKCGVPGQGDIGLVVACEITPEMVGKTVGIAVNAEFKTDTGIQSDAQKAWQAAFESRGGVYGICRSEDDLLSLVDNVKNGKCW